MTSLDLFIRQFTERAARWDDLEDGPIEPWTDPDHPDERLDAAYRSGIVPPAQRGPADGWDSITVLRARGRRLAKRIGRDGSIESYDSSKHFDLASIPVDGLDHLEEDLRQLLHQPGRCVVRGGIAEIGRARRVRRLLHPDAGDPASLVEVPRRWLALDIDTLARPTDISTEDVAACASIAIAELPSEFRGIRCIAQATASHGFKPGIRLRLWYWLDRPVSGAELKRWLLSSPVDHSLFGAAQIIYTAAPIFDDRRDPLPNRMVRLPGLAQVILLELPEPERPQAVKPAKPAIGLSRYADQAAGNAWRNIVEAKAGERDRAINRESYGLGQLAAAGVIPPAFALSLLHRAASLIPGYTRRDASKVDRSFNDGLRNPRGAPHD